MVPPSQCVAALASSQLLIGSTVVGDHQAEEDAKSCYWDQPAGSNFKPNTMIRTDAATNASGEFMLDPASSVGYLYR